MIDTKDLLDYGFIEETKTYSDDTAPFKTGKLLLKGYVPMPTVDLKDHSGPPVIMIGGMQFRITNRETLRKFFELSLPRFCEKA